MNMIKKPNGRYIALLLPAAYLIHLVEEYYGGKGLPLWISEYLAAEVSNADFLNINAFGFSVVMLYAVFYSFIKRNDVLLLAFGSLFFLNGIIHLLASLLTLSYSPGTLSGIVIYLPLGILIYRYTKARLSALGTKIGILAGIIFHAVVTSIALNI
jgi:hypothetical protein